MNVMRLVFLASFLSLLDTASAAQSDEQPAINYPALPQLVATVEDFVSPGWTVVSKSQGDLNRDGRADVALALWTEKATKSESNDERRTTPYRLVIALAERGGGYRLVVDNKSLIESPGYTGAYEDPLDDDALKIVRGSLDISRELLRGHYRYRFRWSDGAFRLIGYEYGGSDGACITLTSINFLTRRAKIQVMPINEDWSRKVVRRIKSRPLATLNDANADDFYTNFEVVGDWPNCPRSDE